MNSQNSKISDPNSVLFNLSDKINLKRHDIYVAWSNLSIYYTQENVKNIKTINFKYQLPHKMTNLNYLMIHILCLIFKIILGESLKTWNSD